jgi:uncharacterized protein (TIGR02449 family)
MSESLFAQVEAKLDELLRRYRQLESENLQLRAERDQLREKHQQARTRIESLITRLQQHEIDPE